LFEFVAWQALVCVFAMLGRKSIEGIFLRQDYVMVVVQLHITGMVLATVVHAEECQLMYKNLNIYDKDR
jgi:hypothetical protein